MTIIDAAENRSKVTSAIAEVDARIITDLGDIIVRLYPSRAPTSVAGFLTALAAGCFDGGLFGRTVRSDNDSGSPGIEVIQAYASKLEGTHLLAEHESTTISGFRHRDGTLSVPRTEGSPGSPLSFFICIGEQPALDAGGLRVLDGEGFAAFGEVIKGMDIVRAIHGLPSNGETDNDYVAGQILSPAVPIHRIAIIGSDAPALVAELAQDYWDFQIREFPVDSSFAGEDHVAGLLDGASEQDHERRAVLSSALLSRAADIDAGLLHDSDKATIELLRRQLQLDADAFLVGARYMATLYPFGFFDTPDFLLQQMPLGTAKQNADLISRFSALPRFLSESLELFKEGMRSGYRLPEIIVPRITYAIDAHLSANGLIARLEKRLASAAAGPGDVDGIELRRRLNFEIIPKLQEIRAAFVSLPAEYLSSHVALSAQPGGSDYYSYLIRYHTSLDITPEEVHATGLSEVSRINSEIDDALEQMGRANDRAAVAVELDARQAADGEELLLRTRALAKKIDGLIPQIIGKTPRAPYGVEPMTIEASHGLPPALAQPAPADGSMPGIYLLTALPEKCPLHLLVPLTLHEAWPGHLMQLALTQEQEQLPMFRRHAWSKYNGYVEGWALYCERLGYDLGLYGEQADRFGLLGFEMWRAVRLVVDTGIHWHGWSRSVVIHYMAEHCFLPRAKIESEVDRYIGMPGQALSYKMGERVIARLRAEAEAALGSNFSLRAFHDAILETGPISLDLLERHIRRWISGGGK